MRENARRADSEHPDTDDDAPEAAFDVAPELFGASVASDGRHRIADDTAR